jgi:hypothetical protein
MMDSIMYNKISEKAKMRKILRLYFFVTVFCLTPLFTTYAENHNTYVNHDVGFSISAPSNWLIKKSLNIRGNLISFFSKSNKSQTPDVGISLDVLRSEIKDIDDFANTILNVYLHKMGANVVNALGQVNFKNASGVMIGVISPQGAKGRVNIKHYFFQKGQNIISVMFQFMEGSDQDYNLYHHQILDSLELTINPK